jgi:hypothetical protein
LLSLSVALLLLQVGVGGGMKSGVAFWRALKSFKEIHPCWAHLNGTPLVEADLPRPISTEYKSVFDLPNTRSAQEQAETQTTTDAVPRTTVVAASKDSKIESQGSKIDVQKTLEVLAAALREQVEGGWTIDAKHAEQEETPAQETEGAIPYRMSEMTVI